jgi:hypothetical protein
MNSNLENAGQGELALTDWVRVAGLLIFVAFICFSIVLFGKGANHHPANQTQVLLHSSAPTAGLELRPESTPEARSQSVMAVTVPETRPGATTSSSEALTPPIQQPLSRSATEGPTIVNVKRANAIRRHRTYLAMRWLASRRRSAVDKFVLKSVNILFGMWRHTWETGNAHGRRAAAPSKPSR